jgi:hypothetical protein
LGFLDQIALENVSCAGKLPVPKLKGKKKKKNRTKRVGFVYTYECVDILGPFLVL